MKWLEAAERIRVAQAVELLEHLALFGLFFTCSCALLTLTRLALRFVFAALELVRRLGARFLLEHAARDLGLGHFRRLGLLGRFGFVVFALTSQARGRLGPRRCDLTH